MLQRPLFEIEKEIGSGRFGKVFLGKNKYGNRVLIKQLNNNLKVNFDEGQLIIEEFNKLCKVQHPFLVSYLNAYADSFRLCIAMDYCETVNLSTLLSESAPADLDEIMKIFIQILLAVEYLHNSGISHEDLQLKNISLDEHKIVKVADFNISKILSRSTETLPSDDVFALGVVLGEMIRCTSDFESHKEFQELSITMMSDNPVHRPSIDAILTSSLLIPFLNSTINHILLTSRNPNTNSSFYILFQQLDRLGFNFTTALKKVTSNVESQSEDIRTITKKPSPFHTPKQLTPLKRGRGRPKSSHQEKNDGEENIEQNYEQLQHEIFVPISGSTPHPISCTIVNEKRWYHALDSLKPLGYNDNVARDLKKTFKLEEENISKYVCGTAMYVNVEGLVKVLNSVVMKARILRDPALKQYHDALLELITSDIIDSYDNDEKKDELPTSTPPLTQHPATDTNEQKLESSVHSHPLKKQKQEIQVGKSGVDHPSQKNPKQRHKEKPEGYLPLNMNEDSPVNRSGSRQKRKRQNKEELENDTERENQKEDKEEVLSSPELEEDEVVPQVQQNQSPVKRGRGRPKGSKNLKQQTHEESDTEKGKQRISGKALRSRSEKIKQTKDKEEGHSLQKMEKKDPPTQQQNRDDQIKKDNDDQETQLQQNQQGIDTGKEKQQSFVKRGRGRPKGSKKLKQQEDKRFDNEEKEEKDGQSPQKFKDTPHSTTQNHKHLENDDQENEEDDVEEGECLSPKHHLPTPHNNNKNNNASSMTNLTSTKPDLIATTVKHYEQLPNPVQKFHEDHLSKQPKKKALASTKQQFVGSEEENEDIVPLSSTPNKSMEQKTNTHPKPLSDRNDNVLSRLIKSFSSR